MSDNSVPLPPLNKRRKLSNVEDIEEAEEKSLEPWDLSKCDQIISISNDNKKTKKKPKKKKKTTRKKDSKFDKLIHLNAHKTKFGTDIAKVRRDVLSLITDPVRCKAILDRIETDLKLRAQGANIIYQDVKTADGRTVKKKVPFLSHIKYAAQVPPKGGAVAGWSSVEYCALITGTFNYVNVFHEELKCDRKLAPWEKGNIGKIERVYIMIMVNLKLGIKYPNEVWQRTSLYKKVRDLNKKKNTDLYSLETRNIFSSWGKPEDIQSSTNQCLLAVAKRDNTMTLSNDTSYITSTNTNSSSAPTQPYPPCLPLKQKPKKPTPSDAFYHAAITTIAKIGASVDRFDNESIVSFPSVSNAHPIIATPSSIKMKPMPPTISPTPEPTPQVSTPQVQTPQVPMGKYEALFTKFVGNLFKIEPEDKPMDELKTHIVSQMFASWEIEEYKLHIVNLMNYVNAQSALDDKSKLDIIKTDLKNLKLI